MERVLLEKIVPKGLHYDPLINVKCFHWKWAQMYECNTFFERFEAIKGEWLRFLRREFPPKAGFRVEVRIIRFLNEPTGKFFYELRACYYQVK